MNDAAKYGQVDKYVSQLLKDATAARKAPQNPFYFAAEYKGHFSLHYNQTDDELLRRATIEHISAASSFNNMKTARNAVAHVLMARVSDITKWYFQKPNMSQLSHGDYKTLTISAHFAQNIGYGIKNQTRYLSKAVNVIIERDYSDDSPYGFFLKTAYVDLANERFLSISDIQPDIIDIVENTALFKNDMERFLAILKTSNDTSSAFYQCDGRTHHIPTVKLRLESLSSPNISLTIGFTNTDFTVWENNTRLKNNEKDYVLGMRYPDEAKQIAKIRRIYDAIRTGKQITPEMLNEIQFSKKPEHEQFNH